MLKREEILKELYETEFVDKFTREKCLQKDYVDDYIQEVWKIICEIPECKLIQLYDKEHHINGVRRFVAGIICRAVASSTSPIYAKLVKHDTRKITQKLYNDKKMKYDEQEGWL